MNYPSEHLLNSVEEIATIKDGLALGDRSLTSAKGLYVKTKSLPSGEVEYTAGGMLITRLVFYKEPEGRRTVGKYQPGGWEFRVEETLELCRTLKRVAEEMQQWPAEKTRVYQSDIPIDEGLINNVTEANRVHYEENQQQWRIAGMPRWNELRSKFYEELKQEWPIEYAELQSNPKGEKYIAEVVKENITKAYVTGHMYGMDWITPEEFTQATLHLGEAVANKIRRGLKGAKSRGIALADVLAHIAAIGTIDTEAAVEAAAETGNEAPKCEAEEIVIVIEEEETSETEDESRD
jgi:hypothetical protein